MIKYVGFGLIVLGIALGILFLFPSDEQKIKTLINTSVEKVEKTSGETTLQTGIKLKWVKEIMTSELHFVFPDAEMDEKISRDDLIYQILLYRGQFKQLKINLHQMKINVTDDTATVSTIIEAVEINGEKETPRDVREVEFALTKIEKEWFFSGAEIFPLPTE